MARQSRGFNRRLLSCVTSLAHCVMHHGDGCWVIYNNKGQAAMERTSLFSAASPIALEDLPRIHALHHQFEMPGWYRWQGHTTICLSRLPTCQDAQQEPGLFSTNADTGPELTVTYSKHGLSC